MKIYPQISVTTFHLGGFALAQQSHGRDSAIKIQGASFSSEECPAISWEDFQVRVTTLSWILTQVSTSTQVTRKKRAGYPNKKVNMDETRDVMVPMPESVPKPELHHFSKTDNSSSGSISSNRSSKGIDSSRFQFQNYIENWLKII